MWVRHGNDVFAVLRVALAASLLLAAPRAAAADGDATGRTHGPCAGCLSSLPAGTDPRPLLVVLHGDGESAASIFDVWETAAAARGVALFAPACPRSEGCTNQSWWKWDGDVSWLLRQIDALAGMRPIDRDRMWIAGWSGGATYVAWNTQDMERAFAALVIVGGGVRPKDARCSEPTASIYFLGGDANPLHHLTDDLHDHYVRCAYDDVTWTVLRGVDHPGERRALAQRREAILAWLETKRRIARGADLRDTGAEAAPDPPAASN